MEEDKSVEQRENELNEEEVIDAAKEDKMSINLEDEDLLDDDLDEEDEVPEEDEY